MSTPGSSSGDDAVPKCRQVVLHAAEAMPAAKATPALATAPAVAPQTSAGEVSGVEQVTGAAASRRKRRRKLAEGFASGERTFGSGEDPEMMQAFLGRGLRTGGAAGRAAVAECANQTALGAPWPLRRDDFPPHVIQKLVREGAAVDVRVEISTGATPFLNMAGPRDSESNIVHMFWRFVWSKPQNLQAKPSLKIYRFRRSGWNKLSKALRERDAFGRPGSHRWKQV